MKERRIKKFWNENKRIIIASLVFSGVTTYFNYIKEEKPEEKNSNKDGV